MIDEKTKDLPVGWEWKKLGDICQKPEYGWTTSASNSGNLKLLRTTDITSGNINWANVPYCKDNPPNEAKYLLREGDIVISRAGSVGYSHLVTKVEKAVFASYLIRFRPLITPKYMAYFLQSPMYWRSIAENKLGIAVPNVNASKLSQIEIPIAPLDEQQRIVARIEELFTQLDAGVAALEAVRAQVKRYRQAVLQAAVSGELTKEWRAKNHYSSVTKILNDIHNRKKDKRYPIINQGDTKSIPEGWEWVTTGQICDCIVPNRDKPKTFSGNIPWITLPDFNTSIEISHSRSGLGLAEQEIEKYRAKVIPQGSVVMSCVGRFGITAVLKRNAVINQQLHAFLVPNQVNAKYLAYALRTKEKFMGEISTATTIAYMNKENCNSIPIPFPTKEEQDLIVEAIENRLSIADQVEKSIDQSLQQAARLRQSILQRAFTGKLA